MEMLATGVVRGSGATATISAVGGVTSYVTVLSVLVEAVLGLPATSWATPAVTVAITVPLPVIPLTATL